MSCHRVLLTVLLLLAAGMLGCASPAARPVSVWQLATSSDLSVREMLKQPNTMTWVRAPEGQTKRTITESIEVARLVHSAEIIFNDCVFTEPVRFTSCELGRVYFRNCEFQQGVSFHGTTLSDRVGFVSCEVRWPEAYEDDANLDDTIAGLDLRSCKINGNLTISTLLNEGFLDLTNLVTQDTCT